MHSFTDKAVNDLANAPGVFTREGVLFWSDGPSETASSFPAKLVTSDGAHPVTCWAPEPFLADPDKIFKVQATVFASPCGTLNLLRFQHDDTIHPLEVTPERFCTVPGLVTEVYGLVEAIRTPELHQFVRDVFSLRAVFRRFWRAGTEEQHLNWAGGLASHAADVADVVAQQMPSYFHWGKDFSQIECDLGIVTALLHDIGKTVSYDGKGLLTERAALLGHPLLGVELLRGPLDALRRARPDLADAVTVLLLSRTQDAREPYDLEAIMNFVASADRFSVECGMSMG